MKNGDYTGLGMDRHCPECGERYGFAKFSVVAGNNDPDDRLPCWLRFKTTRSGRSQAATNAVRSRHGLRSDSRRRESGSGRSAKRSSRFVSIWARTRYGERRGIRLARNSRSFTSPVGRPKRSCGM
jgi:hypothetical protein